MTTFAAELITAVCVVVGGLWTLARWIGKVDQNTVATEKLTLVFEKFSDKTDGRLNNHDDKLNDHEVRIVKLETK